MLDFGEIEMEDEMSRASDSIDIDNKFIIEVWNIHHIRVGYLDDCSCIYDTPNVKVCALTSTQVGLAINNHGKENDHNFFYQVKEYPDHEV